MPIDKSKKGMTFPPYSVAVEPGRLRFFAKAIGETNPIYLDESAAKAAGYSALPVPPTFLFSLENELPDAFVWFNEVGLDLKKVLHGEQSFTYFRTAVAGETLTFTSKISDIFDKKNGALEFAVKETTVTDAAGKPVAELKSTIVQRNA